MDDFDFNLGCGEELFLNWSLAGESRDMNMSLINCSLEHDTQDPLYEPPIGITILLSLFYGLISLVSVFGNATVIFIVVTSRRMQSVTNFFIANLALADVIIGLFSIPFRFQAALLQRWNLPNFMCPFSPFFENVSVNASIFTLTAIAVDRYRAIIYPLKSHASKMKTKGIIVAIWLLSIVLAVPMAIAFRVEYVSPNLKQCLPYNLNVTLFKWYMNLLVLVQYFIPLVLISFAYIRMAVVLWGSQTPGAAQIQRDKTVNNNKKKVIKMLMVVVVMFTLAWFPFHMYSVLTNIFPEINYYPYINIIWFFCHWLSMSNSCYNPFIYFLCNDKFKKEARIRFGRCFCCRDNDPNNLNLYRNSQTFYRGRRMQLHNNGVRTNGFAPSQDTVRRVKIQNGHVTGHVTSSPAGPLVSSPGPGQDTELANFIAYSQEYRPDDRL